MKFLSNPIFWTIAAAIVLIIVLKPEPKKNEDKTPAVTATLK